MSRWRPCTWRAGNRSSSLESTSNSTAAAASRQGQEREQRQRCAAAHQARWDESSTTSPASPAAMFVRTCVTSTGISTRSRGNASEQDVNAIIRNVESARSSAHGNAVAAYDGDAGGARELRVSERDLGRCVSGRREDLAVQDGEPTVRRGGPVTPARRVAPRGRQKWRVPTPARWWRARFCDAARPTGRPTTNAPRPRVAPGRRGRGDRTELGGECPRGAGCPLSGSPPFASATAE